MAVLNMIKGPNPGASIDLVDERIVIGRNAECQVVLNEPAVSREHAVIRRIQGKFYIEDLKSRNHTFVNNKEVTTRTLLKDSDRIRICDNILAFFDNKPLPGHMTPAGVAPPEESEEEEDSSTVEATLMQTSKQVLEAQPAERLSMLIEVGAELMRTLDLEQLLPKIVDSIFQVFRQADRAFIIFHDEGKLIPKEVRTRRANDEGAARFSRKIVNRCLETGQSVLSEDATADQRFDLSQSIADCRIRSVMCVPVLARLNEPPLGVIQLDTQDRFKRFTQDDLKLLLAVAGQAAIALENARMHETLVARAGLERDLRVAREVQQSFLPKKPPLLPGYEFHAHYESAQEVGGDYYDFIPLPGPRQVVMLGDVAGKGMPAALLMAKVSSDARYCTLTEANFATAITTLNVLMQEAGMLDRFVTLIACLIDPEQHTVTFVNAGHLPPLIYRKSKNALEEGTARRQAGLPLGVDAEAPPYEAVTCRLEPGDSVLLFTDGITDAKNKDGREFGMANVLATLKAGPTAPQPMIEHLVAAVQAHSVGCKQFDDIAVASFGRHG
jgi:sigma-B regulation protein RsbU (phosphoserine phosphatase)